MDVICRWGSPLGGITLASDGAALTGLWFDGQRYFARGLDGAGVEKALPLFAECVRWLETYFSGAEPDFTPPLRPRGTAFQTAVWEELLRIPYGGTVTYGALAGTISRRLGHAVSPRAVGAAVGRNPVSLIVPCHRVVGAGGALTGYAGGLERKRRLLELEVRTPAGK